MLGGLAARNQAEFESDVAKQNATISRQRAAAEAARVRRDTQRRIGATQNAFGASGVTLEGTPIEVLGDQAMVGEEDAQLILFGGEGEAYQHLADASAAKSRGDSAIIGGIGNATGSLLTGSAQFKQTFG